MAWIESHQELAKHPKTRRVARALGEGIPSVLGRLHMLWWFALDYADDGDLGRYTDEDIADAMLWEGEPTVIIEALVSAGVGEGHGFLDRDELGRLHIHDWQEYAGRLVEQREKAKARVRKWRNEHATHSEPEANGDVTRSVRVAYDSTGPNLTGPNQTKPGSLTGADAPGERKPKVSPSKKADAPKRTPANAEQFVALCEVEGEDPGNLTDTKRGKINKHAAECADMRWTKGAILKIRDLWAVEHPEIPCSSQIVVLHGARLLRHPPRGPCLRSNGKAPSPWPAYEVPGRPDVVHADGTITDADGHLIGREGDALN